MSWLQSTLWRTFVRQNLSNTSEEQVFNIAKNLHVPVISKAFYKYSFVSEWHLFPASSTLCDATGSLRSGSGLLRKLIFCSCIHRVSAKHMGFSWDFDRLVTCLGISLYPYFAVVPFLWIDAAQLLRPGIPTPTWHFSLWHFKLVLCVNNFISVISISAFTFPESVLFRTLEYEPYVPAFIRYSQE